MQGREEEAALWSRLEARCAPGTVWTMFYCGNARERVETGFLVFVIGTLFQMLFFV